MTEREPYDYSEMRMCGVCFRMLDQKVYHDGKTPPEWQHSLQDQRKGADWDHDVVVVPVDLTQVQDRCDFCNDNVHGMPVWTLPCTDFHVAAEHWSRGDWAACEVCAELLLAGRWGKLITRVMETYPLHHFGEQPPPRGFFEVWYGNIRAHQTGPIVQEVR